MLLALSGRQVGSKQVACFGGEGMVLLPGRLGWVGVAWWMKACSLSAGALVYGGEWYDVLRQVWAVGSRKLRAHLTGEHRETAWIEALLLRGCVCVTLERLSVSRLRLRVCLAWR